MNTDVVLWALGALFTIFTGISYATLRKVSEVSNSLARLEVASSANAGEVTRLRDQLESVRNEVSRIGGAHELAKEIVRVFMEATQQRRRRAEDR